MSDEIVTKHLDNNYLMPERLEEVIQLIVVSAVDKYAFRSEEGVQGRLSDKPKSATSWLDLAQDHPEFFRYNKEKKTITLLIRFLQTNDAAEGELRERLGVDQTQKLVDQAIALHDKQLLRYQRDSSKSAIKAAYIAAAAAIIVPIITVLISIFSNNVSKSDIEIIKNKLEMIEKEKNVVTPNPNITPTTDTKKDDSVVPTQQ